MSTPVTNFGKVTVSTGYSDAAVSIVLTTGHGSRLPSTFPYPLTWWNATDYSDPADDPNKEIVTVTARAGDTVTVTRAVEGTAASNKNTGGKTYKMLLGITAAMWAALSSSLASQTTRALAVRTHTDSDRLLSQVVLVHADAIVMDDGVEIATWDDLVADVTASGAGGLDTGSEAASVWYEIYAIYNPLTTTKKIMLHRAKDYFLDESWDQSGGTTEDGQHLLRDATARTKLAQGFTVDTAGAIEFVDVKLAKVGTPTGNFWFTIEANSGGVPSNTPLATSDKYDVARLPTTSLFVRLPFRVPATVSAATQYHLVLQGDFTVSASNHLAWRADTTAATYANGAQAAFDGATWTTDTDDDFLFKLYITRNDVAVTLPSGYTQKAKISFVYNDGSSNLRRFLARGRRVQYGTGPDAESGTWPTTTVLIDCSAFFPPVEVFGFFGSGANAGGDHAVGDLKMTDLAAATQTVGEYHISAPTSGQAGTIRGHGGPILVEYNAVMGTGNSADEFIFEGYEW